MPALHSADGDNVVLRTSEGPSSESDPCRRCVLRWRFLCVLRKLLFPLYIHTGPFFIRFLVVYVRENYLEQVRWKKDGV